MSSMAAAGREHRAAGGESTGGRCCFWSPSAHSHITGRSERTGEHGNQQAALVGLASCHLAVPWCVALVRATLNPMVLL